jgi:RNA polymerase sigma factor (sigma-70 family)
VYDPRLPANGRGILNVKHPPAVTADALSGEKAPSDTHSATAAPPVSAAAPDARWIRAAMDQFESLLVQYAARLLMGDVERARDVVQDTFLKLWTADRATVNGHLGQWLYRVCRNRALDVRRKEVRMTRLQAEQVESRETAGRANPEARKVVEESSVSVLVMLDALPEQQQEAVRLKFQGGLSYREISNVMDITVNHVGVLIHNGLKAIRERLTTSAEPQLHAARAAGISGIVGTSGTCPGPISGAK